MNTVDRPCRAEAGSQSKHAFTLIELTAVLVMVAFMSCLVWPALASSNDHGTRTVCANNLRQLGTAMTLYASENRDYLAPPNWGNSLPGWLYTPVGGAPPNLSQTPYSSNPVAAYSTGLWFQYVRNPKAYLCPVDGESKYFKGRANKLSSYIMNGAVCGYSTSPQSCKITEVWNPGCYLLWEPDEVYGSPPLGAFAFNDGSTFPDNSEGLGRLHTVNGGQLLTVGGSVQFVNIQRFGTEKASTGKSLVWWSVFSSTGR